MNKLNHKSVSICKSLIRIVACVGLVIRAIFANDISNILNAMVMFGILFGVAELLGIIEELADKRKE